MITFQEWLALNYQALTGSDDDDGDTDADADVPPPPGDKKDGADDADDADGDVDDGNKSGDDDDETDVTISAKELENIRQENARLKREERKRTNDAKKANEKKQRDEGRHEEIAKEREEERDEAKTRQEAAEFELDQTRREIRTRDAASKLNFREPADAIRFLSADDTETDESVSRALKKLAEKKSYLLNDRPRNGRAGNGSGGADGGLTVQDIKGMSTAEVAKRMPEVEAAMQRSRTGGQ